LAAGSLGRERSLLSIVRVRRARRQKKRSQLLALVLIEPPNVKGLSVVQLSRLALYASVLDLERVVVLAVRGPTPVPKSQHHNLRIAGLAAGHPEGALLPPQ